MNQQPASFAKIIMAISSGVTVCMVCAFASIVLQEEVEVITRIGLFSIPVIGAIFAYLFIWSIRERVLILQAQRKEAEAKASVQSIVANEGQQVYLREENPTVTWQPLHLNPLWRINGRAAIPSEVETRSWYSYQELRSKPGIVKAIEPAGLLSEPPLDLLTVFSQPLQAYATIGGQQTGKTYQNQHIASAWVRQGTIPYVIATKWDIGEWPGCKLLGGNADWGKVERGLSLIQEKATERHDSKLHHKSHPILPVFIDDWTPTVNHVKSATDLILNATTMFASVNMILYFIIHSDTADAWGVGKKGAALKNNFVKLFIRPQRDLNGSLIFSQSKGEIIFPGESDVHPVQLINSPVMQSPMVVEANAEKPTPTAREIEILEMWDNADSYRQITTKAYDGQFGDYYNRRVDAVLKKFGRI